MASHPRTVLVTGANRGIGFSILQALATKSPSDRYLLGTRTIESGHAAVAQLREQGITSTIDVLQLDVTSNASITAAEQFIREKAGKLDILINNAGLAQLPGSSLIEQRASYNSTLNTNVASIAVLTSALMPLLLAAPSPRVIHNSSERGSLTRNLAGTMPPTMVVAYNVSKTALNALTIQQAIAEPRVKFYAANPGFCKTAFNGFQGFRDPLDGAKVFVELAFAPEGKYQGGFWEMGDQDLEARTVPW
ncbi:MAG: hypothetical protein LQ351_006039 [Letrouitia transgressa]|nr:MAG: hypothetical protein LQ351_006039 [Letrouitia transgressa]